MREFHKPMSQMPPTVAIITHPSQNNTTDTVELQVHASVMVKQRQMKTKVLKRPDEGHTL